MAEDRRAGRGRLSSIDQLPEEAEPDLIWVRSELAERTRPQTEILADFNDRLAAKGIEPVSKSAFNRWSVRIALQLRKLDEVHIISREVASRLQADATDDVTVLISEMIKAQIYEHLEEKRDPLTINRLAASLDRITKAQASSAEVRRKHQDARDRALKAIDDASEELAGNTEAASSQEVLRRIREDVYGIFTQ